MGPRYGRTSVLLGALLGLAAVSPLGGLDRAMPPGVPWAPTYRSQRNSDRDGDPQAPARADAKRERRKARNRERRI